MVERILKPTYELEKDWDRILNRLRKSGELRLMLNPKARPLKGTCFGRKKNGKTAKTKVQRV